MKSTKSFICQVELLVCERQPHQQHPVGGQRQTPSRRGKYSGPRVTTATRPRASGILRLRNGEDVKEKFGVKGKRLSDASEPHFRNT